MEVYETPELVEYGTVEELTQGAQIGESDHVNVGSGGDL
jgi:hypothetical protein